MKFWEQATAKYRYMHKVMSQPQTGTDLPAETTARLLEAVLHLRVALEYAFASKEFDRDKIPDLVSQALYEVILKQCRGETRFWSGEFSGLANWCVTRILRGNHRSQNAKKRGSGEIPISIEDLSQEPYQPPPNTIETDVKDELAHLIATKAITELEAKVFIERELDGLKLEEVVASAGACKDTVLKYLNHVKKELKQNL